jgi:hypothetical protein
MVATTLLLAATTVTLVHSACGQQLPAPPFGPQSNGGWFGKERHIAPAGGRKPHIAMILMVCRPGSLASSHLSS